MGHFTRVTDSVTGVVTDVPYTLAEEAAVVAAEAALAQATNHPLTRRQFETLLNFAGLASSVQAAITAIPDAMQRAEAQATFDTATTFEASNPLLQQIAAAASISADALSAMWAQALATPA